MTTAELLNRVAKSLVTYLETAFEEKLGTSQEWWQSHVVGQLTFGQRGQVQARGISELGQLDLAALLRVYERNFSELRYWHKLENEYLTLARCVKDMRHAIAHVAAVDQEVNAADIYRDRDTLFRFANAINMDVVSLAGFKTAKAEAFLLLTKEESKNNTFTYETSVNPIASQTTSLQDQAKTVKAHEPAARAIGKYRLHGPGDSIETEVSSFDGKSVAATEIPWRVTGPGGLELMVHLCLIDDPLEGQEVGQVFCDSRMESPQFWDGLVRRLRVGIRQRKKGDLYMDLRIAQLKAGDRPNRKMITYESIDATAGFDLLNQLKRLGAIETGTRAKVTGETGRSRNWPCVAFAANDLSTPVAAWVGATIAPLNNESS